MGLALMAEGLLGRSTIFEVDAVDEGLNPDLDWQQGRGWCGKCLRLFLGVIWDLGILGVGCVQGFRNRGLWDYRENSSLRRRFLGQMMSTASKIEWHAIRRFRRLTDQGSGRRGGYLWGKMPSLGVLLSQYSFRSSRRRFRGDESRRIYLFKSKGRYRRTGEEE